MDNKKTAKTFGKVIKLPKNTDVVNFMENVKIARNKYWYIVTEKEVNDEGKEIHLIKYNQEGINSNTFVSQLKAFYINSTTDENMKKMFENIKVVGNDKFSIIKNIPNIEIIDVITENNKKVEVKKNLISKITSDLIKLLRE
jgi:hypothetical protein